MKKITIGIASIVLSCIAYKLCKKSSFARNNLVYYEEKWKDEGKQKTALVFVDRGKIVNSSVPMSLTEKLRFYRHIDKLWKKSTRHTNETSMPCYAIAKFSNGEIYSYPIDRMFFGYYKASLED